MNKAGLVQVERQVTKAGNTFSQHFWVKASEVKSTDTVLSGQPTPAPDKSATQQPASAPKSVQPTDKIALKQKLAGILGSHSRADMMEYAKKNGVTWNESPNEGVNWMRASMRIQSHMSQNPNTWNDAAIGAQSSNTPAPANSQPDAKKAQVAPAVASKPTPKSTSAPAKSIDKDALKKKIHDLSDSIGRDALMKLAKSKNILWNESTNAGVNYMRASMSMFKTLKSDPGALTQTSDDIAKKSDDVAKKVDSAAAKTKAQVADVSHKVDDVSKKVDDVTSKLKDITNALENFTQQAKSMASSPKPKDNADTALSAPKSKLEEQKFGSALKKASIDSLKAYRTLGMCASDPDADSYLKRLYGKYSDGMAPSGSSASDQPYDRLSDKDPLRNKLAGVVNKQIVDKTKRGAIGIRSNLDKPAIIKTLFTDWSDPNGEITDTDRAHLKTVDSMSISPNRAKILVETSDNGTLKRVLNKLEGTNEYHELAKDYKKDYQELENLCGNCKYIEDEVWNAYKPGNPKTNDFDSIKKLGKEKQNENKDKLYNTEFAIKAIKSFQSGKPDDMSRVDSDVLSDFYKDLILNSRPHKDFKGHSVTADSILEILDFNKLTLQKESKKYENIDSFDTNNTDKIKTAQDILMSSKNKDINANLYMFRILSKEVGGQYEIKKDFVENFPVLSSKNFDTLDKTGTHEQSEALTNLAIYAGMFKPSLAKKAAANGSSVKDILLQGYQSRQELLDTYGDVKGKTDKDGYTEDNEVKCKVSKVNDAKKKEIVDRIEADWDKVNHKGMKYTIKGVYEVSGLELEKEFSAIKKANAGKSTSNHNPNGTDLFYHGTGSVATSLILGHSGEFKVGAAKVGRMLGDGIYLADTSSKSAQYISDAGFSRHGSTGSLMVCEASLGNTARYQSRSQWDSNDSVFAGTDCVANDEWCVHNPKAIIPRYLVEMELE